eukprot:Skav236197  [mRNA]  locus=scaffold747:23086:31351:- [translate_table: standard]
MEMENAAWQSGGKPAVMVGHGGIWWVEEREKQEWDAQHSALLAEHAAVIEQMFHGYSSCVVVPKQDAEKIQRANRETMDRPQLRSVARDIKEKELAFRHHQDAQLCSHSTQRFADTWAAPDTLPHLVETLAQLEQDADREIEELKEMYERKLAQEKDDKVRLRGQAGIHQKYHIDLQSDMMTKGEEVKQKASENRKAEERILSLMKDKDSNEKEIKERDKTIADKEQRIFDLKKQLLDCSSCLSRLCTLAQIDPKTADIASMKTQTRAMEDELNDYKRKNKQLVGNSVAGHGQQAAMLGYRSNTDRDVQQRVRFDRVLFCFYVTGGVGATGVHALQISQLQMKQRALQEERLGFAAAPQRDYLEKSVDSLKRKLEKDSQAHRIDNMRIMQDGLVNGGENVSLIREINDLSREINALKHERQAQETGPGGGCDHRWGGGDPGETVDGSGEAMGMLGGWAARSWQIWVRACRPAIARTWKARRLSLASGRARKVKGDAFAAHGCPWVRL